jgi:hypothetical protein
MQSKRVLTLICGLLLAIAIPLQACADVTLKGLHRVDPCVEMRSWQQTAAANLDDPTTLSIVGETATACAETYALPSSSELPAVESTRCDIYLTAAAAYNSASHLETGTNKKLDAGNALNAYGEALGSCSMAKRDQHMQDSLKSSLDQVRAFYLQLPSE